MAYHKVLFSRSGYGTTAGIVIDASKVDPADMTAVSRLFPISAAVYMRRYHVSPAYTTFDEAFAHVFDIDVEGNPKP